MKGFTRNGRKGDRPPRLRPGRPQAQVGPGHVRRGPGRARGRPLVHEDAALPGHGHAAHRGAGDEPATTSRTILNAGADLPQRLSGHLFQHPAPPPDEPVPGREGGQEAQPRGAGPSSGRSRTPGPASCRRPAEAPRPPLALRPRPGRRPERGPGRPGPVLRRLRHRHPERTEHLAYPRNPPRLRQLHVDARRAWPPTSSTPWSKSSSASPSRPATRRPSRPRSS